MSKSKSINKLLNKSAKVLDKTRNPLDKLVRLSVNTGDIAHRVVRNSISEVKSGVDSVVDISTNRLRNASEDKPLKDIIQAQLDLTSSDARALTDVARKGFDNVADGVVDALDEVSNTYDAYRADAKSKTFEKHAKKPAAKKAA